jgi:hypothetical protein
MIFSLDISPKPQREEGEENKNQPFFISSGFHIFNHSFHFLFEEEIDRLCPDHRVYDPDRSIVFCASSRNEHGQTISALFP